MIITDYLSKGSAVTGAYYADELCKLHEALKSKRRGKLRHGVLLLHDNTPVHTSAVATSAAAERSYKLLPHPPYWPHLAPSDFYLFPMLINTWVAHIFQVTMTSLHLWRSFFRGKMNSSTRLVHKSCRNDGRSALKLAQTMCKNTLLTVVVLCFFIYEARNFWNNPRNNVKRSGLVILLGSTFIKLHTKYKLACSTQLFSHI